MKYMGMFIKKFLRFLLKPMSFLPAILVMYLIFSFSAQDSTVSSQVSGDVSEGIVSILNRKLDLGMSEEVVEQLSGKIEIYVRKLAHFMEYFILAVSVAFPLYVYGVRGLPLMITAGLICVGFACLDEYHQSFVAGRNPSKKDVGIDSAGAILGIIITRIVGWTGRKTIFRPLSKHTD